MIERRNRFALPLNLKLAGWALIALPALNYFSAAWQLQVDPLNFYKVFLAFNKLEILLLILPILGGIGLLRSSSYGWWFTVGYALLLTSYNIWLFQNKLIAIYGLFLLQTIVGFALFFFLIRRNTSAPYMVNMPRGWRRLDRKRISIPVTIDGHDFRTRDVSLVGIYTDHNFGNYILNQTVSIQLKELELQGGIVRIDSDGIGIAFRKTSPVSQNAIEKLIRVETGVSES